MSNCTRGRKFKPKFSVPSLLIIINQIDFRALVTQFGFKRGKFWKFLNHEKFINQWVVREDMLNN